MATKSDDINNEKGMKMVTLISNDKERFEVSEAAASLSWTISKMIEDGCVEGGIPVLNVTAKVLSKVLEYCNRHTTATTGSMITANNSLSVVLSSGSKAIGGSSKNADAAMPGGYDKEIKIFDEAFIDVDQQMLYNLLMAANYLEIKGLLDLCLQKVADMVKGKTPDEIRKTFNIKNDFTPEEEEETRKEIKWAFE